MDKNLLKDGIKEIVAQKGRLLYDTYKDIIGLYLAQRKQKRPTYYAVDYTDANENEFCILMPLTKENIEEIKKAAIDEADGCEDFDYAVSHVLCEADYLYAEGPTFSPMLPTHIDLDHPHYLYDIQIAVFENGINSEPDIRNRRVELNDDDCTWLVYKYMVYPYLSFSALRRENNELYNKMCGHIESNIEVGVVQIITPLYTVDLTEIKEIAALLNELHQEVVNGNC